MEIEIESVWNVINNEWTHILLPKQINYLWIKQKNIFQHSIKLDWILPRYSYIMMNSSIVFHYVRTFYQFWLNCIIWLLHAKINVLYSVHLNIIYVCNLFIIYIDFSSKWKREREKKNGDVNRKQSLLLYSLLCIFQYFIYGWIIFAPL